MKCPVCLEPDLTMTDRQGIEIDYCPRCRGVWLDRGELDKIIERSVAPSTTERYETERGGDREKYRDHSEHRHGDEHYQGKPRKKKGGFLEDLFDFD